MLQRGDSDFVWYKQRVQTSRFLDRAMASTATNHSQPLNPEPADPKERSEHHLPPKSFADAVQQPPPAADPSSSLPQSPDKSYASSATAVEDKEALDEDKVVYEKHGDASGRSGVLTSVKPADGYEQALRHNGEVAPMEEHEHGRVKRQDGGKQRLASGRTAGAGWQRSAYVEIPFPQCW
jgi:2-acylglycerol O-acyltransferase 2